MMPAWRNAPPNMRRARTARWISATRPAMRLPTGQPSPFDRATETRSNGAAEIAGNAEFPGGAADRLGLALRKDDAAAAVMRILDRHQRGRREDDMARRLVGGAEILGGEKAAAADDAELHAGIGRCRTGFVPHDMRLVADDDFIARPGQHLEADLVRHGAARHEQRRFLAEQRGDALLQAIDRGILAILVIADGRFG